MEAGSRSDQNGKMNKNLLRWIIKWLVWIIITAIIFFGGWGLKENYSVILGRTFMTLGFLLAGALLVIGAIKSLK
jgi:quinol-cytochrome oxidoreductase complex cytochrome b subunit